MGLINNVDVVVNGAQDSSKALVEYNTVVLKQNIRDSRNMLTRQMMSQRNIKYVIKWAYTLAEDIVLPNGCLIEFDGGSIKNDKGNSYTLIGDNTILIYSQELEDIVKDVELEGTFIHKDGSGVADEEDITISDGKLKFKDKPNTDGMGKIILRKNKTFGEQVTQENTIYVIQYDFDLNGEEITIPENCVLKFEGGNLSNGTLVGNNTILIYCQDRNVVLQDIILEGTFTFKNMGNELPIKREDLEERVQESLSKADSAIQRVKTINGQNIEGEGNIDVVTDISGKADKATTLAGYGITDAYTKNEADAIAIVGAAAITGGSTKTIKTVDDYVSTVNENLDTLKGGSDTTIPTINAAIASEVNRATIAEELLQEQYNALTQSDKIIGPLPASGHKDVIYRVPGTNSYSDYMYVNEGDTTPVLMATYNNGIDSVPTPYSENIVSSGGIAKKISETTGKVWLRNGSSGNPNNDYIVSSSFIPTNGKHRFKVVITRPNMSGYKYRVGYCLTESVTDLYTVKEIANLAGYVGHQDTPDYTGVSNDLIFNFGYGSRPIGISCQIDEVSIDDPAIRYPLRVDDFNDYTVSIVDYDDDELYVYTGSGTDGLVVEEVLVNENNKSVYIHNGKLIMRSKNMAFSRTFVDNTAFAEELGVSLVTSPTGVQNCIELPSTYCIVLDKAAGKYKIKERYEVSDDDVVIMGCADGKLVYLINGLATGVLYKHNHDTDERLNVAESEITALKTINSITSIFRNGSAGNPANEKVVTSAFINCTKGSVKINVTRPNTNGYRYLYGYALTSSIEDVGTTRHISQMAGHLFHADSEIEVPNSDKDIIDILSNACVGIAIQIREVLIEDYEAYKRGDILAEDVRYNNPFHISEFENSFISLEKVNEDDDVDVDLTKAEEFNLLFKNAYGDVEPFIFFSDPHYCQIYDDASFIPSATQNINNILSHYKNTATNFVLCGGDWLTNHKQSVAVKTLARIDGLMNKTFDKYYPVFGNHDNNYQGELDTIDSQDANDGTLSNQQMVNLWFRKYGKMYYSFNGTSTRFYVFNTGIDWVTEMNDYRWEQVDWFANQLLNNNDSNIVIVMHIISNDGADFANITPMSTNITAVAQAFNNRTSITMNGHTYNFSGKTGKVRCALCGHTHYDYITTLNSIPVYCITTAMDGTFDLVLLDYGASKLKTVRVGSGNNKEMNII